MMTSPKINFQQAPLSFTTNNNNNNQWNQPIWQYLLIWSQATSILPKRRVTPHLILLLLNHLLTAARIMHQQPMPFRRNWKRFEKRENHYLLNWVKSNKANSIHIVYWMNSFMIDSIYCFFCL
jgi:hypothetical protein